MRAIKSPGNPGGYRWYVLETKRNRESDTEFILKAHGFRAYVPRIIHWPLPADGGEVDAMFPGFVFVKLRLADDYDRIVAEPGVKCLMTFGKEPTVLPGEAIDFLRSCERPDGVIRCGAHRRAQGPAVTRPAGLSEIVERRLPSKRRIEVLIEVLRNETQGESAEGLVTQA